MAGTVKKKSTVAKVEKKPAKVTKTTSTKTPKTTTSKTVVKGKNSKDASKVKVEAKKQPVSKVKSNAKTTKAVKEVKKVSKSTKVSLEVEKPVVLKATKKASNKKLITTAKGKTVASFNNVDIVVEGKTVEEIRKNLAKALFLRKSVLKLTSSDLAKKIGISELVLVVEEKSSFEETEVETLIAYAKALGIKTISISFKD